MQSFTVSIAEGIQAVANAKTVNIPHGLTSSQLGGLVQIFLETQNPNASVNESGKNPNITCDGVISGTNLVVSFTNRYTGNVVWKIYVTRQGKVEI